MTHIAAAAPWSVKNTVIVDANGNSIASAGNNRKITGDMLTASLALAAASPELLAALNLALAYNDSITAPDGTGQLSWVLTAKAAVIKATRSQS